MNVKVRPRTQGAGGWEVDIVVCTPNGEKIRRRLKSPLDSKSESRRWGLERARYLALHGDPKEQGHQPKKKEVPKLADFVEEYLDAHAIAVKPSTLKATKKVINVHLLPWLGKYRLDQLDARTVDGYTAEALKRPCPLAKRGRTTLSPKSVSNHLEILISILNQAVTWELIPKVPKFQRPKVTAPPFVFLDFEQSNVYLRTAEAFDSEWYPFLVVAMRTGIRLGEGLAMTWDRVDRKKCVLRIDQNWTPEGGFGTPKSDKPREVPLSKDTIAAFELQAEKSQSDLVFTPASDYETVAKTRRKITYWVERFGELSGVGHVHPHALRHTFASHCVMRSIPLKQVQEWMGHASIEDTMRYAHLAPNFGRGMIERLDGSAEVAGGMLEEDSD